MHRVLNASHKLDLPRCFEPMDFKGEVLAYFIALSEDSAEQDTALKQLTQYSIDMIKAHGSALNTDVEASGKLISSSKGYEAPFQEVSCSLQRLFEVSDTVPYPELTEAYQFQGKKFENYKESYQEQTGAAADDDSTAAEDPQNFNR